ncbi:MAG: prepilin peptidase [Rhodoferax sp.]|nr:prepilin peptidase [Rhodoferax sp.]
MLPVQWIDILAFGLLGLAVGSFLNVVVHRLPKVMERQWQEEYEHAKGDQAVAREPFNLMVPRSRCPHCGHAIGWRENIPVLSYLWLRGKCSACAAPISVRYPLVELCGAALFAYCGGRWGATVTALAWSGFSATILALALIDWDTTLLPDDLTLPLLWGGLVVATLQWSAVPLTAAIWGVVAGYLSLWAVYWVFKLTTGKEGMGYGDFKLFAALGAWFGWQALIPIILMASIIGALVGIAMKFSSGLREGGYVPFGPFLAGAGLTAMVFGPDSILRIIGL